MKKLIALLGILALLLTACAVDQGKSEQPAATEPPAVSEQAETIAQPEASAKPEATAQPEAAEEETLKKSPEILAVYSCPATQIITGDDNTKELADTVIYLYQDLSYVQYVDHDNRYEVYSAGSFETNFD